MNVVGYQSCLSQGISAGTCFYLSRFYANGREQPGEFSCYDTWQGPETSLARKIAIREAARMYGFNPPNPADIESSAQQIVNVLSTDPNGVYSRKPCGDQWDWYALACFFNWYFWLNAEAQAQVRQDITEGNKKWAMWAIHFGTLCPNEVRNDPVYAQWYAALYSSPGPQSAPLPAAINPSWDRKGLASQMPVGPFPQPWPVLRAGAGSPLIPMLPVAPCEPFPGCVVEAAMAAGLPMPCEPFPECAIGIARGVVQSDPTLEMTVAPDGRGTYVSDSPPQKPSSPSWLVPALLAALGIGVVATAAVVLES
jgi:hypothetical protein